MIITSNFSAIGNEADSSRLLSCEDPWGQCGGIIPAYTDMLTRNMYFCPIFFEQVDASTLCNGNTVDNHNIRGSTVIHQMFHSLVGETEDYARFGCYQDQQLSDDENMKNADSYGVSPKTPLGLPRARVLTWGCNLCSASLPRPGSRPSAVWAIRNSKGVLMNSRIIWNNVS